MKTGYIFTATNAGVLFSSNGVNVGIIEPKRKLFGEREYSLRFFDSNEPPIILNDSWSFQSVTKIIEDKIKGI